MLAITGAIVLLDAVWLASAGRRSGDVSFARVTCGAGSGSAMSPEWALFDVDARFQSSCEGELFPIPGLACPGPVHGAGVITLPSRP